MGKITDFEIGDKFKVNEIPYMICLIEEFYYLVNLNSGGIWTSGMDFDGMLSELNAEGFKQL